MNRTKNWALQTIGLLVSTALTVAPSMAMRCTVYPNEIAGDVAFIGNVVSSNWDAYTSEASLQVSIEVLGIVDAVVLLKSDAPTPTQPGQIFAPGPYFVSAFHKEDGTLWTNSCWSFPIGGVFDALMNGEPAPEPQVRYSYWKPLQEWLKSNKQALNSPSQ